MRVKARVVLVSFAAVFLGCHALLWGQHCVTSQRMAAKEPRVVLSSSKKESGKRCVGSLLTPKRQGGNISSLNIWTKYLAQKERGNYTRKVGLSG